MATYVNDLRLKEIGTGESSGTWGTETNVNLELIGEALGYGTEGITTNADTHTTTVADGSTDPGRAMYIEYTGTLDSACTVTIAPNTLSRLHYIENGTSGSQNIIIKQGSGATVTIPPGDTKAVYLDGAGSGAKVVDVFASFSVVDLKVQDDLTVTDDATVGGTLGVTGILTCTDDIIIGDGKTIGSASDVDAMTIASNGQVTFTQTLIGTALDISGDIDVDGTANLDIVDIDGATNIAAAVTMATNNKIQFRDDAIHISSTADGQLDLVADTEIQIAATTIDINGAINASGEIIAASLDISGNIDVDGTTNLDVVDIDGAVDMASTLQVDGAITSSAGATITVADNTDNLTIVSTDADATTGPNVNFYRNSGSPADNDHLGEIRFTGRNDNSQDVVYSNIETRIKDASDGTEDGYFDFETMLNGTLQSRLLMNEVATVVNEDSLDIDFRVESNGNANAIFVNGGDDRVTFFNSTTVNTASGTADGLSVYSDGRTDISRASAQPLNIRRRTDDGSFIEFYKEASGSSGNVGKIGVEASNNFFIADATAGVGLNFKEFINPCDSSGASSRDNFDLGHATQGRLNNIYIGGSLFVGGTAAANGLDDYEEGTWTPTIFGGTTAGTYTLEAARTGGVYTKIGRIVHVSGVLRITSIDSAGAGTLNFGGLPFTLGPNVAPSWGEGNDFRISHYGAGAQSSADTYPPPFTGVGNGSGTSTLTFNSFGKNYQVSSVIGDLSSNAWIYIISGTYYTSQ